MLQVCGIWERISQCAGVGNGKNTKGQKTALSKLHIILSHLYIWDQYKYINVYTGN